NGAGAFLPRPADQHTLHGIANRFARRAGDPRNGWFVETLSLPPCGIWAGCVDCGFHRAGKRLAQLIARHQQTLAMLEARGMKLGLLQIWFVVGQLILGSLLFRIAEELRNLVSINRQVHRLLPRLTLVALAAS